jgi:HEPN domain-containing protein
VSALLDCWQYWNRYVKLDIPKQVEYWRSGAVDNLETAEILLEKGKRLEGLFFCHLAIEKALKAHVAKITCDVPPKTHNLKRLADLAGLTFKGSDYELLARMMEFQIEGRYPEMTTKSPNKKDCTSYLKKAKEFVEWLNVQL